MVLSTGVPSLADKRYFLSQMSSDASWKGMASTSLCSSLTTLFMDGYLSPEVSGLFQNARTGGKNDPNPQFLEVSRVLYVGRLLSGSHHSSPQLPNPKMSRHNILCWGRESRHVKTSRQETSLS